ncbi:transmembrane protein 8A-like [Limulus polyphemus]|uniref:Transmembrane protein 8A-like n=1 Tax=Limulus polyphemus TaxID=6850 RepID=A0ABM1TPD4_LIMPO|nr:transmembrane protein 8A-like [Limulus polyphemus]
MATRWICATLSPVLLILSLCSFLCRITTSEQPAVQILEARELLYYTSYSNVQIFHYNVPVLTYAAVWEFKANISHYCSPKPVSVYLQYGSYPVVNPQNETFPRGFHLRRQHLHHVTLLTNSETAQLNISCPLSGDWYAIAFVAEKFDNIVQMGSYLPCQAWLTSNLITETVEEVPTLSPGQPLPQQISAPHYYRFYAPRDTWSVTVTVTSCASIPVATDVQCPLVFLVRPKALPSVVQDVLDQTVIECTRTSLGADCAATITSSDENWNYILVEVVRNTTIEFSIQVDFTVCQETEKDPNKHVTVPRAGGHTHHTEAKVGRKKELSRKSPQLLESPQTLKYATPNPVFSHIDSCSGCCWKRIPLVRHAEGGNFAFWYVPWSNNRGTPFLNISTETTTLTTFEIYPVRDIGGTLEVTVALPVTINITMNNISLTTCLEYGIRPSLSENGSCRTGLEGSVNTSTATNRVLTMVVPFPEAGMWYLTLTPHCYFQEKEGNENEVVDVRCYANTTSVNLNVNSSSCVENNCGDHGKCYSYYSGGFVFSTCVCSSGWRGWGCTDDTNAVSDAQQLLEVLLLTLSNIAFIPAILLSVYRLHYTEGLVYLFTMCFSVLYHACDAEVYNFCMMRLSVLQFCDFYSVILAFWVTLIAMADLPTTLQSLAHMAGAVGIALAVEYDRTGLWVFVTPCGIGLIILLISWVSYHTR